MRLLTSLPALALALAVTLPADGRAQHIGDTMAPGSVIDFTLKPSTGSNMLDLWLRVGHRFNSSHRVTAAALPGFDRAMLIQGHATHFSLVREAGQIDCDGAGSNGAAAGTCHLTPDAGFAEYLARRGLVRPSFGEAFALTVTGATRALVEVVAAGSSRPATLDELVQLAALEVSPAYVPGLAATGYRRLTPAEIVQFRAIGITPAYLRGIAEAGYPALPAGTLVQLKAVGVTPEEARAARVQEGAPPSADRLILARVLLGAERSK